MVAVFEGNDAAGKGGAIRRVTQALDARRYRIVPIAAPSKEEAAHPYLWRFWRQLPEIGKFTLFDRSWYGRVLVERVEGLIDESTWRRAYGEIRHFEQQLSTAGIIVVKFWLAIDADEQLKRFQAREATGFKRFKITDDDWRNRAKWDDYAAAAQEMFAETSASDAPWALIDAGDKHHARIHVLRILCKRIEHHLQQGEALPHD